MEKVLARLFVIVGGLLVAVLTAALVAPYFIDWTSYRADFEREASRILGRSVTVRGPAEARLLPFPSVSFSDVQVAGSDGEDAMTVETFSMDAELAPFLRGEILIYDMRLTRPSATIEIGEDGAVDWAMRPTVPVGVRQISLERLTVEDGTLTIRHRSSGRVHVAEGLDATVSARTLAGPWRIEGHATVDGIATGFGLTTGEAQSDGAIRVRTALAPDDYPLVIETDGAARMTDSALTYGGTFSLRADQAGTSPQRAAVSSPERKPGDYRVSGAFSLTHAEIDFSEFRLETGPVEDPYTADGTARIELGIEPRFMIRADGAQVRFDPPAEGEAASAVALGDRIDALQRFLAGLPRPTIPGKVEVNLPAVVVGDTTIRSVALSAEPRHDGWEIEKLRAQLPGRTTLEASGRLATVGRFGFDGPLLVAIGQPSGFAAWIARDVDDAIRRLPAAGFSATVSLGAKRQRLEDVELILGGARFAGRAERAHEESARPTLAVSLEGGQLDIDGLTVFASLFVTDAGVSRLADHDVDLAVKAGPVSAQGLSVERLDTALRLREDAIEVDRLSIDGLEGASISATGTLRDFPEAPRGKIDLSVISVDLAPLVATLAERYPGVTGITALADNAAAYPGLLADARFDLVATAVQTSEAESGLALSANGIAGGTLFTVAGSAALDQAKTQVSRDRAVSLTASARNDDAANLYALVGLPALPLGLTGPAEIEIDAKGTVVGGIETKASLSGERTKVAFNGRAGLADGFTLTGRASVDSNDLEPWMAAAGFSLPGFGYGLPVKLAADLTLESGKARFAELSGSVADDQVSGEVALSVADARPHIAGTLSLGSLDLADAAALVWGEDAVNDGDTAIAELPPTPFQAGLKVKANSLLLGSRTIEEAEFDAKLDVGTLSISNLAGRLHGGSLSGFAEIENSNGEGLFSAQIALSDAEINGIPELAGLSGRGDLSASLTASGKTLAAMVASTSGSGTARARDLVVAGIDAAALPEVLAEADRIGRDVDAAATARFAPDLIRRGSFRPADTEAAFAVAGGQLRVPPVLLQSDTVRVSVEGKVDLTGPMVDLAGEIAYAPGDEALVGSEPVLRYRVEGAPQAVERSLDTGPLAQFLIQRALEREQARVEAMQAVLLEQQRLRRETRYYLARVEDRAKAAEERRLAEEAARLKAEEEARLRAEAEAKRVAEEAERRAAEAEAARKAAEEAAAREEADAERLRQEAQAKSAKAEAEARKAAEKAKAAEERAKSAAARDAAPQIADPDAVQRAPLPAPEATSPNLPGVRPMFDVFREDGASIDEILKSFDRPSQ